MRITVLFPFTRPHDIPIDTDAAGGWKRLWTECEIINDISLVKQKMCEARRAMVGAEAETTEEEDEAQDEEKDEEKLIGEWPGTDEDVVQHALEVVAAAGTRAFRVKWTVTEDTQLLAITSDPEWGEPEAGRRGVRVYRWSPVAAELQQRARSAGQADATLREGRTVADHYQKLSGGETRGQKKWKWKKEEKRNRRRKELQLTAAMYLYLLTVKRRTSRTTMRSSHNGHTSGVG